MRFPLRLFGGRGFRLAEILYSRAEMEPAGVDHLPVRFIVDQACAAAFAHEGTPGLQPECPVNDSGAHFLDIEGNNPGVACRSSRN